MADLISPLAGKVWKVQVAVGDKVEVDDEVMILEAMKMETPVYAPESGTVKEIKANVGESVEEEQVLMVIE